MPFQLVKKPRGICRPQAANQIIIIFRQGVYLVKNSLQRASVRPVRRGVRRSGLQSPLPKSPARGFSAVKKGTPWRALLL